MLNDAQEFSVSKDDKLILRGHGDTREWKTLKAIIEKSIQKWTANLLKGNETYQDSSFDALKELRGFVRFWSIIIKVVENQNDEEK